MFGSCRIDGFGAIHKCNCDEDRRSTVPDYGPLETGFDDDGKIIFLPAPSGRFQMFAVLGTVCPCCGYAYDGPNPTRRPPTLQ